MFEDVQWIDPTSLELLILTVERVARARMLLLVTARPEFAPPWPSHAHVSTILLGRLDRQATAALVDRVVGGKMLPAEVLEQILARADGVPLFVEEMTKAVLESGMLHGEAERYVLPGRSASLAVPSTLHDSLMARIDRLAPVRDVVQIGAALGRVFSSEVIQSVSGRPAREVESALDQLVASELIFRRGTRQSAVYTFKHALVQEAAYGSLLRERRRQLHARIASVLEGEQPELVRTQPEVLAQHYGAAGLSEQAIEYYRRASHRAMATSANSEAIAHLTKGLELIAALPESPERNSWELEFQLALGMPVSATQGYAAPALETIYERAKEISGTLGEGLALFQYLVGLNVYHLNRGRLESAQEISTQALEMATRLGHPDLVLIAHTVACFNFFYSGQPASVPFHAKRTLALYAEERHSGHKILFQDPAVIVLLHWAKALWLLGYPDQAREKANAGVSLARKFGHAFTLCGALVWEGLLRHMQRDSRLAVDLAQESLSIAREQGFALFAADSVSYGIWASGKTDEASIKALRGTLADRGRIGSELVNPILIAQLGQCLAKQGNIDQGIEALQDAISRAEQTGERWWLPEMYRMMGDMLFQRDPVSAAGPERSFDRAIELSRGQSAKSLELRAVTSLARLWRDQGKHTEARDLLTPIYDWFTEGSDAPDLKDAKALLNDLILT
jgi:predicted ATPase